MPYRSDARLLVLHALQLKGVVETDAIAQAFGLAPAAVALELDALATSGLVRRRDGLLVGWQLTTAGRAEHQRLLAAELAASGALPVVDAGYQRFLTLNPGVLDACSRWQVRELSGRMVRNDHTDPAYDEKVLDDLTLALSETRPLSDRLATALARFDRYAPGLEGALDRALAGERDYVTRPVIPSFHTVWFEMHEDLLETLGLDRGSEG